MTMTPTETSKKGTNSVGELITSQLKCSSPEGVIEALPLAQSGLVMPSTAKMAHGVAAPTNAIHAPARPPRASGISRPRPNKRSRTPNEKMASIPNPINAPHRNHSCGADRPRLAELISAFLSIEADMNMIPVRGIGECPWIEDVIEGRADLARSQLIRELA